MGLGLVIIYKLDRTVFRLSTQFVFGVKNSFNLFMQEQQSMKKKCDQLKRTKKTNQIKLFLFDGHYSPIGFVLFTCGFFSSFSINFKCFMELFMTKL